VTELEERDRGRPGADRQDAPLHAATYLGMFFDLVRQFFASLPRSEDPRYTASRFSFNTTGGRCETCQEQAGSGWKWRSCRHLSPLRGLCGLRYGTDLADITWKGKKRRPGAAADLRGGGQFFDFHARLGEVCRLMCDCGLGYLTLGQSSPTLSGGEAPAPETRQRTRARPANLHRAVPGDASPQSLPARRTHYRLHLSDCEKADPGASRSSRPGTSVVVIETPSRPARRSRLCCGTRPGRPVRKRGSSTKPLPGCSQVRRSPTAPPIARKAEQLPDIIKAARPPPGRWFTRPTA